MFTMKQKITSLLAALALMTVSTAGLATACAETATEAPAAQTETVTETEAPGAPDELPPEEQAAPDEEAPEEIEVKVDSFDMHVDTAYGAVTFSIKVSVNSDTADATLRVADADVAVDETIESWENGIYDCTLRSADLGLELNVHADLSQMSEESLDAVIEKLMDAVVESIFSME